MIERKSIWMDFSIKKNLNFILKTDFFKLKEKILNPLILPSPFMNEEVFEIFKNKVKGEIYTEVLNLFYFLKTKNEVVFPKFYIYELDIKNDLVKIKIFDLENSNRETIIDKAFTPKGIEEFLNFNNFKLKEIWGDHPSGKIKESTRFLLLRIDKK
ncbi:MAG: hypothetical protein ACPLN1_00365 [Caldisericia bacterium]